MLAFIKRNCIFIVLLAFVGYSQIFFANLSSIVPQAKVIIHASGAPETVASLKKENINYMKEVEKKLNTNVQFKKISIVLGLLILFGSLLGFLFLFLLFLFKFAGINFFRVEQLHWPNYLRFGLVDLLKFLIVCLFFSCNAPIYFSG